MDANIIFQTLTAFILALFAGVFLFVYLYDRSYKPSGWYSVAYGAGLMGFFLDTTTGGGALPTVMLTNTFFWAASGAITAASCARARRPFPLRGFAALMLVGYVSNLYFTLIGYDLTWRSLMTDLVAGFILMLGIPALYSADRRRIDRAVFYCFSAVAAAYILRPIFAFGILGVDYEIEGYSKSAYSLIVYVSTAVMALGAAAVAIIASGVDITEQLQRESDTDHLTGLYNQRGFANMLDKDADKNGKYAAAGKAVLMFDIDQFKRINDQFGHELGDEVLVKIGGTIRQLMKYHGVAGRSGGEEFVFLFSRESSQAAFLVAEHLRVAIGMLQHTGLPEGTRVTISLGLAFVRADEPVKRAMRRADTALYQAKDEGRNCLRLAAGDNLPEADENRLMPQVAPNK